MATLTSRRRAALVRKKTAEPRAAKGTVSPDEKRRRAFGTALAEAMSVRQMTQQELAELLGVTQSAVSAWRTAEAEPGPAIVFACERAIGTGPGMLSRHLGYYPPEALKGATSVEEAAKRDELLDDAGKRAVIAVWRELSTRAQSRRGRPAAR